MTVSSKDTRRELRLTNGVLTMSQDTIVKGIDSPLYIAQFLRVLGNHMFPGVIGPYGFVPVLRTSFSNILLLTHWSPHVIGSYGFVPVPQN